jgi:Uma2 family endonuclease
MSVSPQDLCISESEYLKLEKAAREKHEYVAGRVFAMVGATAAHSIIVGNLHGNLFAPVKQAGCNSFISDMKVKVEVLRSYYYPDLMVSCEPLKPEALFLTAPCLIIEVLSPSTTNVDRREKLIAYRSIASLKEYALFSQDQKQVELYRKDSDGNWHCQVYEGSEKLRLSALGSVTIDLDLDTIYAGAGAK